MFLNLLREIHSTKAVRHLRYNFTVKMPQKKVTRKLKKVTVRNAEELERLERIHAAVCKYFVIIIVLLSLELVNIKDVVSICTFYSKTRSITL